MNKEFWKDRTVLITGHSGFKGSWLCMILNYLGATVYGISDGLPTKPALFELAKLYEEVSSTWLPIHKWGELNQVIDQIRPQHIIHMAAQAIVKEGYSRPVYTFETNVMGTAKLLEACRNIPDIESILVVTTDKVYQNIPNKYGLWETDRLGASDPYSTSKACSELVTDCYRQSFYKNEKIATARAGNVIGGGDFAYRVIPMTMEALMNDQKPPIWDPKAIRPWQNVLDCLNGYLLLLEYGEIHPIEFADSWNFGPQWKDHYTVKHVINKLCDIWQTGFCFEPVECPDPYTLGIELCLNPTKANTLLDWHSKWDLDKTLTNLVAWYRQYQRGDDVRMICDMTLERYLD